MKVYILSGLLITAIGVNIFFFLSKGAPVGTAPKEAVQQMDSLAISAANSNMLQETLQTFMLEQFTNESLQLPESMTTSDGDKIARRKLSTTSSHVLVFRFDRNACSACVEHELTNIAALKDRISADDIIVLSSSFNTTAQAKMYLERFNVPFKIYNITDTLGFTTERSLQPSYFVLDGTSKASLFFMPDKNNPSLSDSYLEIIRTRFLHH